MKMGTIALPWRYDATVRRAAPILAPEIDQQYRSNGNRRPVVSNDLPPNSATFDRRIAAVDARDWFDSDCVLGTQFESSQPHHAVQRSRRFPKQTTNARNWRASWRAESLYERPAGSQGRFRGFVSGPEICVSRKPETWFAENFGSRSPLCAERLRNAPVHAA